MKRPGGAPAPCHCLPRSAAYPRNGSRASVVSAGLRAIPLWYAAGLSIGLTDGQIGLYEARLDGRIGTSIRFGILPDLLEASERSR